MKQFNFKRVWALGLVLPAISALAQPGLQKLEQRLSAQKLADTQEYSFRLMPKTNNLATVGFSGKNKIAGANAQQWIKTELQLRPGIDELKALSSSVYNDMQVQRFQQYFKGLKVEHGLVKAASINGQLSVMQMEFYPVADNFNTMPIVGQDAALLKAMQQLPATEYAWQGNKPAMAKPTGELVIISDQTKETDTVCLAYKFIIEASKPLLSATVYVNAMDGSIAFTNQRTSEAYSNSAVKNATTQYSGKQDIFTDYYINQNSVPFPTYRLRQTRNGHDIETFDFDGSLATIPNMVLKLAAKPDINDPTNAWVDKDNAATEVHFNTQIVSDYWKLVHGRNSFDNKGATITSFVHVKLENPGALAMFKGGVNSMYYSDGLTAADNIDYLKTTGPAVSLDISAHELGHAMAESEDMPDFTKSRESGALNEGFSDIWAACIENYAIGKFPALGANKDKWIFLEEFAVLRGEKGARDMRDPKKKFLPDTYYGANYIDVSAKCKEGTNDACGIHTNCSILTKWFYLITEGGTGTNDNGYQYTVTPLGFSTTEKIAYYTELLLTSNSNYHAVMNTSINYTAAKYGETSNEATQVKAAWRAVGLMDTVLTTTPGTDPVFAGVDDGFTTVVVGKYGHVWAGTSRKGLFKYNGRNWEKSTVTADNRVGYLDMEADKKGGVWMAQAGYSVSGNTSATGGIYYFPDTLFSSKNYYTSTTQNPPRNTLSSNIRSIWVDTSRNNEYALSKGDSLPQVWAAALNQNTGSKLTSGGVVRGLRAIPTEDSNFVKVGTEYMDKVDKRTELRGAQVVGGNDKEVWAYSDVNNEKSLTSWGYEPNFYYNGHPKQIMRFGAKKGDSLGVINATTNPDVFEPFFVVRAIYFDIKENKWVGQLTYGFRIMKANGDWFSSDDIAEPNVNDSLKKYAPKIISSGTIINNNAITGDKDGNVYIGTNEGMIVYTGGEDLEKYESYRRYTIADGLPSNNIRGIAIDTLRRGIWLATDKGITLWRKEGAERLLFVNAVNTSLCGRAIEFTANIKGGYNSTPVANELIVELSDANGNFNSPEVLIKAPYSSPYNTQFKQDLNADLPLTVADGDNYRLRIRSTNPATTGVPTAPFKIRKKDGVMTSKGEAILTANRQCSDLQGWTHYYFDNNTPENLSDDTLLLSLQKNGQDIGSVNDGTFSLSIGTNKLAGTSVAHQVSSPLVTNTFIGMNRFWDVKVTNQPTSTVGVRFYYTQRDMDDLNGSISYGPLSRTQLVFYKTNGNPDPLTNFTNGSNIISYKYSGIATDSTWTDSTLSSGVYQAAFEVHSFSGGGGGSTPNGGPLTGTGWGSLPLNLLHFTVKANNSGNLIHWQTANELNTSRFEVERSTDGQQFVKITTVAAAGSGNNAYAYTDASANEATIFYRLKMADKDGQFTYSPVIKITMGKSNRMVLQPNPARGFVQITGITNIQKITITDLSGKLIKQLLPHTGNRYSIAGIAPGVYMVTCVAKEFTGTQKLVVQ